MRTAKILFATLALTGLSAMSGASMAFDLTNCGTTGITTNFDGTTNATGTACPWVAYGDGLSFNLAVNASLYNQTFGGGTGPSNPFYVPSGPGQLKDYVVVGTGASGTPVVGNTPGMDNAYPTPNNTAGTVFFTTNKTAYPGLPIAGVSAPADPIPTGAWDRTDSWDTSLTALQGFLGTGAAPLFFFNNNQTNSGTNADQSLAIWAQISLTGAGKTTLYFDFTNRGGTFFQNPLGGGVLLGGAGAYTSSGAGPNAGTNASTDYVLSGGQTCFNPITGQLALPTGGSCPAGFTQTVNNNLGANEAAYAVLFPELNAILLAAGFDGYDAMHIDLRMGCDPNTVGGISDPSANPNCLARSLNNGYEQVFIDRITGSTVVIPEPATVALLGLGLLGLGLARRHRPAV